MNYWDSAAIVPLLIVEKQTAHYSGLRDLQPIVTWWGTPVECAFALTRKFREQTLTPQALAAALQLLKNLQESWIEIQSSRPLRESAMHLLRIYPLRAADGLQLAAAKIASQFEPGAIRFLTEDVRLRQAAEREGFVVDL